MTLTEFAYYFKKYLPVGIVIGLVILILFYVFKLFFLYLQVNQTKTIYTNPVFGKISRPLLPQASQSAEITYVLDTIEGQPVTATDTANIYLLPPTQSSFKFLQQIYLMAKAVGIDTDVFKHNLQNTIATFSDGAQKLDIDVTNYNFTYEYYLQNLKSSPQYFTNVIVPDKKDIEDKAIAFLNSVGRYPDELSKGKRNLTYLTYDPTTDKLTPAPLSQSTNMVEIDFYRSDVDNVYPIVTPNFSNSPTYVLMAFSNDGFRIIKAQVKFFEKSDSQVGIYPVIDGNTAWEELKGNKAFIISGDTSKPQIRIKKMFLGYYDPDIYQTYLEPVYVFLGDNNFVAYVPAIATNYYSD